MSIVGQGWKCSKGQGIDLLRIPYAENRDGNIVRDMTWKMEVQYGVCGEWH